MRDGDYKLLLPFDTDESDFTRGFEAGRIWALLRLCESEGHAYECPDELPIHASNVEMVLRMAEATDHQAFAEVTEDEVWMDVSFVPVGAHIGPVG